MLVFFECHFDIHSGKLTQVSVRKRIFSPKDRTDLKDLLQVRTNGHLLVQLRGLSKTCIHIELLGFEHRCTALGCTRDQLRRVDFNEIFSQTLISPQLTNFRFDHLDRLRSGSP